MKLTNSFDRLLVFMVMAICAAGLAGIVIAYLG